VSKDRAAPFSRKHRRYWIPVTGGMILLGVVNLSLGFCSYKAPEEPQRIELRVGKDAAVDGANTLGASELPADVMRAFAIKYPHVLPAGVLQSGANYVIAFPPGLEHHHATFDGSGAFVSDD
jgi:hypothetical protein